MRRLRCRVPWIVVLGCIVALGAQAETVYRWVGEDGSTHFSERPPAAELSSVETLVLEPPQPPTASPEPMDYQRALDLAESMHADRIERERLRLDRLRLQQEALQRQYESAASTAETNYYPYPVYPYRPRPPYPGPGWRPPPHHRPPPGPYPQRPPVSKRVFSLR